MTVSMNEAWDETQAFIRRELKLLVPLVLATIYLGNVLFAVMAPAYRANPSGGTLLAVLFASLAMLTGQLALSWLVLTPGGSVGEALRTGMSRLGRLVLALLVVGAALAIPALIVGAIAAGAGFDPSAPPRPEALSPAVALLFVGLGALFFAVYIKMTLLVATLANQPLWPIAALRESWTRTRGLFWRLLGLAILYFVVSYIVTRAVTFVLGGIVLAASGGQAGFTAQVVVALIVGLVAAAFGALATVFLAMVFKRTTA